MFKELLNGESINWDIPMKKLNPNATAPTYAKDGDAGMDLYTLEDAIIKPKDTVVIPTGIALELPKCLEAQVRPRSGNSLNGVKGCYKANIPLHGTITTGYISSTSLKYDGLTIKNEPDYTNPVKNLESAIQTCMPYLRVQIGTIDSNYRGDIGIITYNQETYDVLVPKGTKLAQMVIKPVVKATLKEVDKLSDSNRGQDGFGSTDVN